MILGIYRADGSFESRKDISRECIIWPHERSQFHKPRKMANRGSAGERGGLSPIPSKSAHNFFCCNFEVREDLLENPRSSCAKKCLKDPTYDIVFKAGGSRISTSFSSLDFQSTQHQCHASHSGSLLQYQ